MSDEGQGLEFALYAWQKRGLLLSACLAAVILAGAVSLLLSKQYTATASILILPPSGEDSRGALALSQVYLESLKTYEQFASGDTLFSGALDDLHLRAQFGDTSIESLKRRILVVSRPTNATYIQIAATLGNAKDAQRLAQYIAERAVAMNTSLGEETGASMTREPQKIFVTAQARRAAAEQAAEQFSRTASVEALKKEYTSAGELRTAIGRDLALARADLANYKGQLQAPPPMVPGASANTPKNDAVQSQSGWIQYEMSAAAARVQDLENQERTLLVYLNDKGAVLEQLERKSDAVDAELKAARAAEEIAKGKLSEIEVSAPFSGVRLKMLDPGIVPQRPSFPNVPLNMMIAFLGTALLSVGYLALRFAHLRISHQVPAYRWR